MNIRIMVTSAKILPETKRKACHRFFLGTPRQTMTLPIPWFQILPSRIVKHRISIKSLSMWQFGIAALANEYTYSLILLMILFLHVLFCVSKVSQFFAFFSLLFSYLGLPFSHTHLFKIYLSFKVSFLRCQIIYENYVNNQLLLKLMVFPPQCAILRSLVKFQRASR